MQRKLFVGLLIALIILAIPNVGFKVSHVSASPTVDGVISPHEYDGGLAVQLVGRWNTDWTVDAYIAWDNEYLYVAVNESVPPTTGHQSWIEFAIDAGAARSYLDAFVIFDDLTLSYDKYPKPDGPWSGQGPGSFIAASSSATEFRVKYTDYGITLGDTIKVAIDRNKGPPPPSPYGEAAFWPQNAIVYDGSPQAQPVTWGDVKLTPLQSTYQLTVSSSPVSGISYTVDSQPSETGTALTLNSGSHTITMPSTITVGVNTYRFAHWENLSLTNPVRTIDLQSDTVLGVTYSNHTIDGVISPGEYADGIVVHLIGPYPSGAPFQPWITNAYISWDTEYIYVAVDEPVPVPAPGKSGESCWIEFQFNTSTAYHSFVLFGDGTPQHVLYPLSSGGWYWDVPAGFSNPYPWYASTGAATEFQVKYTDFGIVYGDLLKMSIDTGKDDFSYPPLGECSVWPNPSIFYPTADASTWGNVSLAPLGPTAQFGLTVNSLPISSISYSVDSQSALTGTSITLNNGSHTLIMPSTFTSGSKTYQFMSWEDGSTNRIRTIELQSNTVLTATFSNHAIDGVISPGEYDGGLNVQLVGRTNPNFFVNAHIAWDSQYLYIGVDEPVPAGGHNSWIEFAMDAGPARPYLDAFTLFGDNTLSEVRCPKPPGAWSGTSVSFIAASSTATEFRIKLTDFGIRVGDTIRLAIDRNQGPAPPPPYGSAAFWPQDAVVYDAAPNPTTWGSVCLTAANVVYQPVNTPSEYEYGKTFQLQVNVTNVCLQMTGFSITIVYDTEVFNWTGISWTGGVLGSGSCVDSPHGTIVAQVAGASPWTGNNGLLFTLALQVQFDDSIAHIWRTSTPHDLTRNISMPNAELTFTDGTLSSGSISLPTSLSITVHLIQGDVNCDGKVDIFDLQKVAQYYDKTSSDPSWASTIQKYDLNNDGSIDLYDLVIVATNFGYGI